MKKIQLISTVLLVVLSMAFIGCPTDVDPETVYVEVDSSDWLGTAPGITDAQVVDTKTADIVIVGAGVAGVATARSAAEEGASVLVIEQAEGITFRGLCFGAFNSDYQKSLGQELTEADKMEVVRQMQKISGNRANMALWTRWVNESGAAFNWFISAFSPSGPEYGYYLEMWPLPESFNNSTEYYPQFQSSIAFGTLFENKWDDAVTAQYKKSVEKGAEYLFETAGKELALRSDGTVIGVYAQKKDGSYIKVLANKAVVLATGDYGNNEKMVKALNPEFYEALNNGLTNIPTSTGEGHKMAIWAGARMEPAPHAHMSHSFAGGFGGIGSTVALHLNLQGKRFMNEDVPGQIFTNQLLRQPGHTSFQVFDSTWPAQILKQSVGHGNLDLSNGFNQAAIQEALDTALAGTDPMGPLAANTIDELVSKMYPNDTVTQNAAKAAIARYNALADNGFDADFGCRADRLFPVKTGPFYASRSFVAAGVTTAGVMVDERLRVLKADTLKPIPGLWAVGNVAGGRYSIDYPTTSPATSHGTAITFGRAIGKEAAAYTRP
jgi:hypothetical protein